MTETVLVIAAHPDDEVLGCGGTIARHASEGDIVHILIMTTGEASRSDFSEERVAARTDSARAAADILGATPPRIMDFPDNRMDTVALLDIIKAVEEVISEIRPRVVYTHHGGDLNVDHRITHQAVVTACRPQPECVVKEIYTFETPSSTEWSSKGCGPDFTPALFTDISSFLEKKKQALDCYPSEIRDFPHARSHEAIEALARRRGCTVGLEAAEAFGVVRQIRPLPGSPA